MGRVVLVAMPRFTADLVRHAVTADARMSVAAEFATVAQAADLLPTLGATAIIVDDANAGPAALGILRTAAPGARIAIISGGLRTLRTETTAAMPLTADALTAWLSADQGG